MKYALLATVVGSLFLGAPASGHVAVYSLQDTLPKNQPDTAKVTPPDSTAKAAADSVKKKKDEKPSVDDKVKSSKKIDGLFTLYRDTATASLQLYLTKEQLDKDFIYQSFSMGGPTALYLNQNMIRDTWLFSIRKNHDKIEFLRKNTAFYYDPANPVSKAANADVAETIFHSEKIAASDSAGYLISIDGLFISNKLDAVKPVMPPGTPPTARFNLGNLNTGKSSYDTVRSFPHNTDVVVRLTYENPAPMNGGGKDITDARYVTVKMQHSFLEVPQNSYRSRRDDPRVGYFGAQVDDLTSVSPTPYRDFISRWHLEKKNPNAKLSEPVEPIVFWIENTTPYEYRPIIKEAGEKWNEAFEAAGFKNAIVMKQMPDDAEWDPADIAYNVIRWKSSSSPSYGAIGPSFYNPLTGQILGADITVEWKSGAGTPVMDDLFNGGNAALASLPWEHPEQAVAPQAEYIHHSQVNRMALCNLANELSMQFQTGIVAVETLGAKGSETGKSDAVKEMHKQFLYYLIMHEMGHTLGLNHNMRASQMLSPEQLHDTKLTRKIGLQGSVMDYPAINVSRDRSKQGDYYTTKAGPYDIWAIEYGYTPFSTAEEAKGLDKILSRSTDPQLAFGNDADDMRSPGKAIDPRVMINDHSSDMMAYGEERFLLVNDMMPKLKERFTRPNHGYQELLQRYGQLNSQRASMASAISRYIGGVYVDRSFVGQETDAEPYTPVPLETQKKAMELLGKYVYAPDAFETDYALFPYLQRQRRGFNFFSGTEDYKPQSTFRSLQVSTLSHILHPTTLARISNSSLYGNAYSVTDVMKDLTTNIFAADLGGNVNLIRQNLQTDYVKALIGILEAKGGYDYASKAGALATLKDLKVKLDGAGDADAQTVAHRQSLQFMIEQALSVNKS
ncbi:zinc-dependent metalloprotease [Parapedobacter sp. 10938]|uniref:zinc-dependent metalloprotease n=1 Tax=Parapedobacter flavus TaxID=3110225 RepID=UPI002DBA262C|nr:zinc-dependent metalloprotease [Parapedobacter sp. 10938]MEC3881104.1 zinc-dependent metalloprotease [Parapedobacter sp. 10938]